MDTSENIKKFMTYMETAFPSGKPEWTTHNGIVFAHEAFNIRCFSAQDDTIPTLIIPPQAGHSSHIADYDEGQSIVESIIEERGGNVYAIEWLSCTHERRNESIEDLILQVKIAVTSICNAHLVKNIHVIGLCQGGWLSAIVTSLIQDKIKTLTCIAAPINFISKEDDGGAIHKMAKQVGIVNYKALVSLGNGRMLGDLMLAGWKSTNFTDRYFTDYLKIINILDDEEKIRKTHRFRTWYENTSNLAGNWYLYIIENLFIKNQLVKKEFIVNGEPIDIGNITCPVVMIAGGNDEITLMDQLFVLGDYVSSEEKYAVTVPGVGHIGCFISKKSQKYIKESVKWADK